MPFSEETLTRLKADAAEITGRYPRARSALLPLLYLFNGGAAAAEPAVATLNGKPIPYSQLQGGVQGRLDSMQQQLDRKIQDLTLNAARARASYLETEIGRLVDDRVVALEAAATGTSAESLINAITPDPISDADMHAFYDAQSVQIGQSFETVAPQLKQYLQNEASKKARRLYLESLRTKYHAVVTWEPMREHIEPQGPERGAADAAVTIVEFSDFECPFCGRFTPVLRRILTAYPAQVRLIFRNYPLRTVHQNAEKAAEAGVCADRQGKFWEMHDVLFAEQNSLSIGALKEKAKRIGMDAATFDHCLDSGAGVAAVQADGDAGVKLGLSSTPSSFVNGRFVNAALSYDEMSALIDDELRRASMGAAHPARSAAR